MKKVKLIYNPFSGNNKIVNQLDNIIGIYQKAGYQLILFRISYEAKLEDAFLDLGDGSWDHLLLAGGDGSVSESIGLMKEKNIDLPVGVLPTGTANDFANCIGMPQDIKESCIQIIESVEKNIDLGKVNGKYFINVLSFGLFTEVSQNTPSNLKNTIGKVAYFVNGIKELPKFKTFKVVVLENGEEFVFMGDAYLVFVFNGKTAGGMDFAYKSEIDDGLLDVIVIKADIVQAPKYLANFLLKNHLEDTTEGILHFKSKKIVIDCADEIVTDIDGEKGPEFPLNIECVPESIRILGYKKNKIKQIDKFLNNLKSNLPKRKIIK
ncbi:MAG: YegS/Rv2252/BmrU family lipid kinase [Psychrilyobacter sp.]|nr:YegS/Rv2252/BmrU family lipid kinase [Psychrilyobacter sp.]